MRKNEKNLTPSEKKKFNNSVGAKGEKQAVKYLKKQGYKIVARNVRLTHGEIDIIARNDKYIIFAEVKSRADTPYLAKFGRPARAVNAEKRYHLISAANEYIRKNKPELLPRGDIIEVYITDKGNFFKRKSYRIEHLTNIFSAHDYKMNYKYHR